MAGKAKTGRKHKLRDAKTRAKCLSELARTGSRPAACAAVAVTLRTFQGEMASDATFREAVQEAEVKARGRAEAKLYKTGINEGSERSLHFYMERKWPDKWGRRNPETITIKDVIILCNRIGTEMAASMPYESQVAARRIIDKHLELLLLGGGGGK